MHGPIHPREQARDPRDATVVMPRIDPSLLADPVRDPAGGAGASGPVAAQPPEFGDPYALPSSGPLPEPKPALAPDPGVTARPAPASEPQLRPEPPLPGDPAEAGPEPQLAHPAPAASPEEPTAAEPHAARPAPVGPPADVAKLSLPPDQPLAARPTAGSIAELHVRLARLPDGHPSALYDEAGHIRPAPTRLRHLELGLPAPERSLAAGLAGSAERFTGERRDAEPSEADAARAADSPVAGSAVAEDGAAVPHFLTDPRENGHRSSRADRGDRNRSGARGEGGQDSDARTDPPAAPWPAADALDGTNGNGDPNGHRPGGREHGGGPDGGPPSAAERSARDGALAPRHRELVDRILADCRAAEGRNVFGGYGSSGITPALQRIAAQLPAGGLAPGSEDDTLKPADRLAAKLARLIARQPGRAPEELAASIADVIRFAFTFAPADYSDGTMLVHRKLKAQGFELEARRNRWDNPEYKGVFTRWRDPAHGVAFEVQFHTLGSWAVIKRTHAAYARITDPATPLAERARLRAGQVTASATVQSPPGWMDIADFRSAAP